MENKVFSAPRMNIIEFDNEDVIATSNCPTYVCPFGYGTSCEGICYDGYQECTGVDEAP